MNSKNISNLKGIEYFTSLTDLNCYDNNLGSLDISKNVNLINLNCYRCNLESLDISSNVNLKVVYCYENNLTSLDVSNNKSLEILYCEKNELENLDVSNNKNLKELHCYENKLTSLNVANNASLTNLDCHANKLTSLDVSNNKSLEILYCEENNLTSLDISKNTNIQYPSSRNNTYEIALDEGNTFDLSTLPGKFDVTRASRWSNATVEGNILTVTDASKKNITYKYDIDGKGTLETFTLTFDSSYITKDMIKPIDVQGYTGKAVEPEIIVKSPVSDGEYEVTYKNNIEVGTATAIVTMKDGNFYKGSVEVNFEIGVAIDEINFPDANFRNYISSANFDKADKDGIKDGYLVQSELDAVESINVYSKNISDLKGIEYFTALTYLYCYYNKLESLDVSNNPKLKYLDFNNNNLTSIDVSKNTNLLALYCDSNNLTNLDVSKNTELMVLDCSSNQLTSLDLSNNTNLMELDCSSNTYNIDLAEGNKFDLSNLPDGFDVTRVIEWLNATVEDGIFTVTDIKQPVTYKYDVDGQGKLETFTLNVNSAPLSKDMIEPIDVQDYTGKAVEPKITVKSPVLDEDYEVTYKNNIEIGTATAIVTMKEGNFYKGSVEIPFEIGVAIDEINFPDANFRNYISSANFDKADKDGIKDGYLVKSELDAVKAIDVNHENISDLKG